MLHVSDVPWPPDPITTDRLRVRSTKATDRRKYIELLCSDEARRYLGGALDRTEVEANTPATPGHRPGVFAVESTGKFIGAITLDRRDPDRPGRFGNSTHPVEISYMFLPDSWGSGYATEAVAAVLLWAERHLPSNPIVLCTQVANDASVRLAVRLGFREVERFVEYDAEQWFGVRNLAAATQDHFAATQLPDTHAYCRTARWTTPPGLGHYACAMEAVGGIQRSVVGVVSAAVGLSVWIVTMASASRFSYGAEQDLGNNVFFWILLAAALISGFLLPSCATVIGFALGLPALLLSPWTAPRGDNDGLWILIVPALFVFLFVLAFVARAGAWLRERLSRPSA